MEFTETDINTSSKIDPILSKSSFEIPAPIPIDIPALSPSQYT